MGPTRQADAGRRPFLTPFHSLESHFLPDSLLLILTLSSKAFPLRGPRLHPRGRTPCTWSLDLAPGPETCGLCPHATGWTSCPRARVNLSKGSNWTRLRPSDHPDASVLGMDLSSVSPSHVAVYPRSPPEKWNLVLFKRRGKKNALAKCFLSL